MNITRGILRWGLIGGLALGGAVLFLGPERVVGGLHHVRVTMQNTVDNMVDDPIALRRQLQQLSEEYPDRIAEVRGEMAEVERQIDEINRDTDIATRVVAMTTEDLTQLKALVTRAESARDNGEARAIAIRFDSVRYTYDQALNEARRINDVRLAYQDRLATDNQQLQFLSEQHVRLSEILDNLESEFSTFQNQLWQIDRQIDAIERNERLIELTKRQEETLAGYNKFEKVGNLKQIQSKLAQLRTEQEAQLESLRNYGGVSRNYEKQARFDIDSEGAEEFDPMNVFDGIDEPTTFETEQDDSVAWAGPVVIE